MKTTCRLHTMIAFLFAFCAFGTDALSQNAPAPVRLEQIISREDAQFNCSVASLNIGRDGMVYVVSGGNNSYLIRLGRDGRDRYGRLIVYAAKNATANADGVVASANGHFAHKVTLYDKTLTQTGELTDFLVNDQQGWDAPAEVEVGASGDFYGVDQHRDRILRISPAGKILKAFAIPREPAAPAGQIENLRVCEKQELFFLIVRGGGIRCVGFDGKTRWSKNFSLAGNWYIGSRAYDCDDEGNLYVLENNSDTVKKFSKDGQPAGEIKLQIGDRKPPAGKSWFFVLRISKGDIFIRSEHPTELFQIYDAASGAFKSAAAIDYERLAASYPSPIWTAGKSQSFTIDFQTGSRKITPRWRLWARPLDAPDYREFKITKDQIEVPADASGLYRIKLTPEIQPWERGLASQVDSEYLVQSVVEIRPADAKGSVSISTPSCRVYYGQGEAVKFSIVARAMEKDREIPLKIKLVKAGTTIAELKSAPKTGAPALEMILPSSLTGSLVPGTYSLTAEAPGYTVASQTLVIGPALRDPPFFQVMYGDYGATTPAGMSFWNTADNVAAQAHRLGDLNINLLVDRIGFPVASPFAWDNPSLAEMNELAKRLEADPISVAPDKVRSTFPFLQCLSAYGANNVRHMGILMGNDAGLPLGSGFDNRKPEQILDTLVKCMDAVRPYPSFRGWSWSSNWWVFEKRGAAAAKTPDEKTACEAAIKKAKETGSWDPIIDKVAGYRFGMAVDAQALFNKKLKEIAPDAGYITSVAAPYRNVESYPPITFSNVDEVDLHIQWEQIAVPYHGPHNVDFYKRSGKRGWAHPEIWNDDGTGGQILTTLFQIAMRGADGVGFSGELPPWAGVGGGLQDDPRIGHFGYDSVYLALNRLFESYGPMLAKLENNDKIAIVASGRMYKIDEWHHVTGLHFARQLEAYISCLHAHQPASFVFAEDIKPDTLKKYKAILLVDERVDLEPELLAALKAAKKAGTTILYDKTCRETVVKEFIPLDVAFDKLEKDRSPAGDDQAYWRFSAYATANVPAISKALDLFIPPAAKVDDPEILISERKAQDARYLWVVNNTMPRLEPGHIWRMNLGVTSRVPVVVPVTLSGDTKAVYDVFAMKEVQPANGILQADLRSLPARLYAILPVKIANVQLIAPKSITASQVFAWQASVIDAAGKPISAVFPLRVRLKGPDNAILYERFLSTTDKGALDTVTAPSNAGNGKLVLEVAELFTGKNAVASIQIDPPSAPLAIQLVADNKPAGKTSPAPAVSSVVGNAKEIPGLLAAETSFGPHVRDMVISDKGKLAVMSTMNWDHNLYAIDTDTGAVRWRQRAGHYFTFSPIAIQSGVAVQGFDFKSAEGYHLYLAGNDGKLERRFALDGIPKRLPHRFVPGLLCEDRYGMGRIDNFAIPDDGSWVASAGDLGLAVWKRDGSPLWSQDWRAARHTATLAALSEKTLLVISGMKAEFYDAATGKKQNEMTLAATGEVRKVIVGHDGKTVALLASTEGGRVFILRSGKVERIFPTPCDDGALSADGTLLSVVTGNQLKLYSIENGLQWSFSANDRARFPRFSPDDKRIAVTSDLGSAYVFDPSGTLLWETSLPARSVPAWLPDGDLILAGWMGKVCRYGKDYAPKWETLLVPQTTDMRDKLLTDDGAPTVKVKAWGNAEATPLPLEPNLIAQNQVLFKFVQSAGWGGETQWAQVPKILWDGKSDPPEKPWIDWSFVGFFAETSPVNYILIDAFRKQLRVNAITFVEDPAHPESWLRDAKFDYWDAAAEKWVTAAEILADAQIHTHKLAKPVEAARFRVLLPWGVVGNLRFGEIVLHGETLGCSHPDAAAKKPVAVLFDEQDDIKTAMIHSNNGLNFKLDAAYSGGRCFSIAANGKAAPLYQPPFGHFIANWDFEIAEKPQPGQYRWLQFAWKANSANTKGITLSFGGAGTQAVAFHSGEYTKLDEVEIAKKIGDTPPTDWKVERIDLWEAFGGKPGRIQEMRIGAVGDGALIDQILLGRSAEDLKAFTSGPPAKDKKK